MRIVLVHQRFPLTSETFVLQQVEGLIARGHDVTILAEWADEHASRLGDAARIAGLKNRVVSSRIPAGRLRRILGAAVYLVRHRASWRVLVRSLGLRQNPDPRSVRPIYRAARFVELRDRVDLVLCHFGTNALRALPLVGDGEDRIPLVTIFHGFDLSTTLQGHGGQFYRRLMARGDLFLAVSERFRARLVEIGFDAARVRVHPTGVELDRFPWRERGAPGGDGTLRLLCVGRLVEKKGFADAIAAVGRWDRNQPRIELRIAGDGPLRSALAQQIDALGAGERVTLIGWQSHERIAQWMSQSDVLLLPSVTAPDGDEEGLPVVLKEAMASGLPVVASRHSAIPECLEHDVTGLLVAEHAPHEIVAALERLVDEPGLSARLARAAREHGEQTFDQCLLDQRLEELLTTLVPRRV